MNSNTQLSSTIPDSPCIGLCSTQFEDVCRGCGRTVMEVANWIFMDDSEKRKIWIRVIQENALRPQKERVIRFRDTALYAQYSADDFTA